MDIEKLYTCLNAEEKETLKELIKKEEKEQVKTPLIDFISDCEVNLSPLTLKVLTWVNNGYRSVDRIEFLEDMEPESLDRFAGIGPASIRALAYEKKKYLNG